MAQGYNVGDSRTMAQYAEFKKCSLHSSNGGAMKDAEGREETHRDIVLFASNHC